LTTEALREAWPVWWHRAVSGWAERSVTVNPSQEHRQVRRYRQRFGVSYSRFIADTTMPLLASDTLTLDISRGGARVLLPHEISQDVMIQLHIHIPELRRPVTMLGRVKWRNSQGPPHAAGIQFLGEMPPQVEEVIAQREGERKRIPVPVRQETEC
jgi:hypothetical protein